MNFSKINSNYEIMDAPCTQGYWEENSPESKNPSYFEGGKDLPVEQVSFDDVKAFINRLNDKKDGYTYRLPTEEEWEYCCRAGSTTNYCFGDGEEELKDYAWFYQNSEKKTHPVKQKNPNAWGLYDMHGNVWEWCDSFYYKDQTASGSFRVVRGGGWFDVPRNLRSAFRDYLGPGDRYSNLGFRLVRTACSDYTRPYYAFTIDPKRLELAIAKAQKALDELKELLK